MFGIPSTDLLFIVGLPAAAIALGIIFGVVLPRIRRRRALRQGITLAAFSDSDIVVPPRPVRRPRPESRRPVPGPDETPATHTQTTASTYAPPAREATGTLGPAWTPTAPSRPPPEAPRLRLEPGLERAAMELPPERTPPLRIHRPADGTLQFLPGRLEIVEGRELGQEIRFVRQPGTGPTQITFGRQDGQPYRHVQLHEPTVSRIHARMTFEDNDWLLTNLSQTNPISVNGASMAPENTTVSLKDGDQIEMGEVVFRFRSK